MDAEAYPEASKSVLQILWDVVTYGQGRQWGKARISALEAVAQYELSILSLASLTVRSSFQNLGLLESIAGVQTNNSSIIDLALIQAFQLYSVACSPIDAALVATTGGDDRGFLWKIGQGDWAFELQGILLVTTRTISTPSST
ncbi:hypothetical protein JHK82_033661 [Glycine max]|nr:hypothetical protein JHK87_033602 [Glycine soja]KAG4980423.1 hypothetical protein JHK85_034381 [Glycine max]KAG4986050.1 hypothetical protein JHK86_033741 [Glycine max]KAG5119241.1 hypothetical protein JHK82_033661 [Glycine max]